MIVSCPIGSGHSYVPLEYIMQSAGGETLATKVLTSVHLTSITAFDSKLELNATITVSVCTFYTRTAAC